MAGTGRIVDFGELEDAAQQRREAERDETERRRVLLNRLDGPAAAWAGAFVLAGACFIIAYAGWRTGVKGSPLMALLGLLVIAMARWKSS